MADQRRVICQLWYESERGWGQRPDGFSLHLTPGSHKGYLTDYTKDRTGPAPDEYDAPDGSPFTVEVTEEIFQKLVKAGNGSIRSWARGNDLKSNGQVTTV
jgi:hypothetical protein